MRNLKKLFAVIVAICMLATFTVPAFAADTFTYSAEADKLYSLGLYKGVSTASFDPALGTTLTREAGIVLVVKFMGKEADALAASDDSLKDATDLKNLSAWAKPYMAYAVKNQLYLGTSASALTLNPKGSLLGKELAAFLLRAAGYKVEGNMNATAMLQEKGGLSAVQALDVNSKSLKRDDAVGMLFAYLNAKASNDKTVITNLVDAKVVDEAKAVTAGVYTKPVVALAVDSVTAINTKQVQVVFNIAVDATKGADETNYTIGGANPGDATVQADGKTVILTLAAETRMTNAGTADIKVLKAVGLAADYTKTINVADSTVPTFASIRATGAKTLELTFSEPVYDANGGTTAIDLTEITVKSGLYTYIVTSATADYAKRTITITTGANLIEGPLTVKINAPGMTAGNPIRDFAGLIMIPQEVSYTYAKDTTVATATLTSVVKETKTATVKFSKVVHGQNVVLYHSVAGVAAYGTAEVDVAEGAATDTWNFVFTNALPAGNLTFYLVSDDVAADQITDLYGVKVPNQTFTYNVVADTTPPTVSKYTVNSNTSIDVEFSEDIDATEAVKAANYELKKADGTTQTITSYTYPQGNNKTVRLNVSLTDNSVYTLTVKAMKDAAGVAMAAAYSNSVTVADNAAPSVTSDYRVDANNIYLVFSEPMNATEVVNKANYLVDLDDNGTYAALADADTITLVANNKIKINIAAGGVGNASDVRIANVHDLAGKLLGTDSVNVFHTTVSDTAMDTLTIVSAEAIAKNKIKITFSKALSAFDITEFAVRKAADHSAPTTDYGFTSIESNVTNASGQQEVVVTLANDLKANATDKTDAAGLEIQAAAPANTKSTEGTVLSVGDPNFADKIAPSIAYVDYVSATKIVVFFDEDLDPAYIAGAGKNGFTVTGGTLDTALKSTTTDYAIVLTGSSFTVDTDVTYTAGNIVDNSAAKNALATVSKTDALATAAVVATQSGTPDDKVTIALTNIGGVITPGTTADLISDADHVITLGDYEFTLAGAPILADAADNDLTVTITAAGLITVAFTDTTLDTGAVAGTLTIKNITTGASDTVNVSIAAGDAETVTQ